MADPTTKTFAQLVQSYAAAVQSRAAGLVDFSVGSILRAIGEATSGVVLWLQALILHLLAITRAATSTGSDLDSWIADYGGPFIDGGPVIFGRLAATPAVGAVTFRRFSTTGPVTIPIGSTVETGDGKQRFAVTLDTSSDFYDAGLVAYVMPNGQDEAELPVGGLAAGAAGNVLAGTVTVITSPIPGIDTVTNAEDFFGGADAERDDHLRTRFRAFLQSLREATRAAVLYWVTSIQQGVTAEMVEYEERNGTPRKGFFYVVVDDGSGSPPAGLMTAAALAVDQHRAAGIEAAVYPPDIIPVDASWTVITAVGTDHPSAVAASIAAVRAYLNGLTLGLDLSYTRLYQVAYDASPDIVGITSLLVNGTTADVAAARYQVIKADVVTAT